MSNVIVAKPIDITWRPDISIFASESFLKGAGDESGWLGGFDASGKLCCILPYTIIKKGFFRMVRFRVETITVGEELELVEEKSFLNSVVDYFRSIKADMIIPATTNTIFKTYPDGAIVAPYATYINDLSKPEETLLSELNTSHRRKLRLAMKAPVQIHCGMGYMPIAYELVRDTFKRSKMGFMDYEAFKRYISSLNENVKILVAEYQGVIQCCVVVPYSTYCAYYVYGGSIPNPLSGATNLLHWEAMRLFKSLGVKRYDFVGVRIDPQKGTRQEGLLQYKQRFGGELIKGYLWKYSINSLKFFIYTLAVRILRGGDIVDQECHKFKSV